MPYVIESRGAQSHGARVVNPRTMSVLFFDTVADARDYAAEITPCEPSKNLPLVIVALCNDCGEPITLQPSGWWSHDGLPADCWRLSMDGPSIED